MARNMATMNLTLKILYSVQMFNFTIIVDLKVIQKLGNGYILLVSINSEIWLQKTFRIAAKSF